MALSLEKAIFINRAPFDRLEIDFKRDGINVLSAINGKGKTTILSHIADAFYEMARKCFSESFSGRETKLYRFSSNLFHLDMKKYSIVYLRFKYNDEVIDYVDCRGEDLTKKLYEQEILLQDALPYTNISPYLQRDNCGKIFSNSLQEKKIMEIFGNNVMTFFPSYRYENPFYLSDPYKVSVAFESNLSFSGYLVNPIEVITEIQTLASWIMDVVLDWEVNKKRHTINAKGRQVLVDTTPERTMYKNVCAILAAALSSRYNDGKIRFGFGKRDSAGHRISIMHDTNNGKPDQISPSIFALSSGELSLLCLFGEIMRQADKLHSNITLDNIEGIVLIDEVDLHLHIKLQKEILPKLFNLFPKIQFIVSSHSPFLNMGLADEAMERTQTINLDEEGIICSPTNNELYNEVYKMMIEENFRFAEKYKALLDKIKEGSKPLVITEGKTDYKHIRNAIKVLNRRDVEVEFHEVPDSGWGSCELRKMLEMLSRIRQSRHVIGIFDRDESDKLKYLDVDNQEYKKLGNNVYALAIPLVNEAIYGQFISIEHYYAKEHLLKEDENHRRLFLGSEFHKSGNSTKGDYQTKISQIKNKVEINGIIDEKVYKSTDLKQETSIALAKDAFATLVESDAGYAGDFNYDNFNILIDAIKAIAELPLE